MTDNAFFNFDSVYVEKTYEGNKHVQNILSNVRNNPRIIYFEDISGLIRKNPQMTSPSERSRNLVLSGIRGDVLRRCPGSHGRLCCNYHVVNLYIGCPIGCSYCILQSYLNQPFTIINVDIENILDRIKETTSAQGERLFRIGTGELGDSLVYDPLTGYSKYFIEYFNDLKNCIFEFKTKTDNIENLLEFGNTKNIVVGFSVNPQSAADSEEEFSTPVLKRLSAAKKLVEKNYKIALHFDPILNIENFHGHYSGLINDIFSFIKPESISWISLGTFRYTGDLKNTMEINYPQSKILCDEFIGNNDKKFRYFLPIRTRLYGEIIGLLKEKSSDMPIYFCMESPEVWNKCLDVIPHKEKKMDLLFKNAIIPFES
jgi:spore photoproduct lyase